MVVDDGHVAAGSSTTVKVGNLGLPGLDVSTPSSASSKYDKSFTVYCAEVENGAVCWTVGR